MRKKPIVISIDGNIGSGKSTLLAHLKKQISDKVAFVNEPIKHWLEIKDENNKNIIDLFYEDQHRWAFPFQTFAMQTRKNALLEAIHATDKKIVITERSPDTDTNVFTKMLYREGKISPIEYKICKHFYDSIDLKSDIIIYVDVEPKECSKRIINRNRPGENIPIKYLVELEKTHLEWIINDKVKVWIIKDSYKDSDQIVSKILNLLKTL